MDFGELLKGWRSWPAEVWIKAGLSGVIAMLLFMAFGLWFLLSLIIGIVVFLAVVWWLHRGAEMEHREVKSFGTSASAPAAAVAARPAPKPEPAPAPEAPSAAEPAPLMSSPEPAAPADPVADPVGEPVKPLALEAPHDGAPDDLKKIKGVGPKLEQMLHGLGCYHFRQIADWGPGEIAWVDTNLEGFHGRATRDDWVGQAKILAGGGATEFSERVEKGEVYDDD